MKNPVFCQSCAYRKVQRPLDQAGVCIDFCMHPKTVVRMKDAIRPWNEIQLCEDVNKNNNCKFFVERMTFWKWIKMYWGQG